MLTQEALRSNCLERHVFGLGGAKYIAGLHIPLDQHQQAVPHLWHGSLPLGTLLGVGVQRMVRHAHFH